MSLVGDRVWGPGGQDPTLVQHGPDRNVCRVEVIADGGQVDREVVRGGEVAAVERVDVGGRPRLSRESSCG